MIKYSILSKSQHWPRRIKKIEYIINEILKYKKELNFLNEVHYYCNFVFANDNFVKKLNKKFKKINTTTDVLTFVNKTYNINKNNEKHCDIVFSIETILKDVKKNNINFYHHLTHLIIHSFLHINNYMHDTVKDFKIMKNKEIYILKKLNINNPY